MAAISIKPDSPPIEDWVAIYHLDLPSDDDFQFVPSEKESLRDYLLKQRQEFPGALNKLINGSVEIHQKQTVVRHGFRNSDGEWDTARLIKQINRDLGCLDIVINGRPYDNKTAESNLTAMLRREFGMPDPHSNDLKIIGETFRKYLSADNIPSTPIFSFLSCLQQGAAAICMEATIDSVDPEAVIVKMGQTKKPTRITGIFTKDQMTVSIDQDLLILSSELAPRFSITAHADIDAVKAATTISWVDTKISD